MRGKKKKKKGERKGRHEEEEEGMGVFNSVDGQVSAVREDEKPARPFVAAVVRRRGESIPHERRRRE